MTYHTIEMSQFTKTILYMYILLYCEKCLFDVWSSRDFVNFGSQDGIQMESKSGLDFVRFRVPFWYIYIL